MAFASGVVSRSGTATPYHEVSSATAGLLREEIRCDVGSCRANVFFLRRMRPLGSTDEPRSAAPHEARKRRASERPHVACCEYALAARFQTAKSCGGMAKRDLSGHRAVASALKVGMRIN